MRDPDLVSRAQRAATALERAWDHWRTSHGLGAEPPPPVSSYVGYSLEEPWGQPRVVFGIAAEEAEELATFLDRHRPAGPGQAGNGRLSRPDSSRLSPAVTGGLSETGDGRLSPAANGAGDGRMSPAGNGAGDGRMSPAGNGAGDGRMSPAGNGLSAQDSVANGLNGDGPAPARLAGEGAAPGRSAAEGPAPGPAVTGTAAADGKSLWRPRSHRHAGEHAAQRPGRPRSPAAAEDDALPPAKPAPRTRPGPGQDDAGRGAGADRGGLAPAAADLAGWASGELPGQASRGPAPWTFSAHPGLNHAEPSNGETRGGSAR
jgi:hypothetical protein